MNTVDIKILFEMWINLMEQGLENAARLFYGFYRGTVTDNKDPEHRGRVLVRVDELHQTTAPPIWILPVTGSGAHRGSFSVPEVGDSVRVFYSMGDSTQPVGYLGGWYGSDELPTELAYDSTGKPSRHGFVTRMGHGLVCSDEADKENVRLWWHKSESSDAAKNDASLAADRSKGLLAYLEWNPDGNATLTNANGAVLELNAKKKHVILKDPNGNQLTMDNEGFKVVDLNGNFITLANGKISMSADNIAVATKSINLQASTIVLGGENDQAVLGQRLISWLLSHTHGSGMGPTSPPIQPPVPTDLLSNTVKLK